MSRLPRVQGVLEYIETGCCLRKYRDNVGGTPSTGDGVALGDQKSILRAIAARGEPEVVLSLGGAHEVHVAPLLGRMM